MTFWPYRKNSLIRKLRLTHGVIIPWLTLKFMTSQPGLQAIPIHTLSNISQSKGNQTMTFGQLIEHSKRNIFFQKLWGK